MSTDHRLWQRFWNGSKEQNKHDLFSSQAYMLVWRHSTTISTINYILTNILGLWVTRTCKELIEFGGLRSTPGVWVRFEEWKRVNSAKRKGSHFPSKCKGPEVSVMWVGREKAGERQSPAPGALEATVSRLVFEEWGRAVLQVWAEKSTHFFLLSSLNLSPTSWSPIIMVN